MKATTQLFQSEGRQNLKATIANVTKAANTFDVPVVIIFAANSESVLALRANIDDSRAIVAVTFPAGYVAIINDAAAYVGIYDQDEQNRLRSAGVRFVQGTMPFEATGTTDSDPYRDFRNALGLFGGGLQLCVQAVVMACDAGALPSGQRCIAMSADTAIVAHSENTFSMFNVSSRFAVEHVICKPVSYTISRPAVRSLEKMQKVGRLKDLADQDEPKALE